MIFPSKTVGIDHAFGIIVQSTTKRIISKSCVLWSFRLTLPKEVLEIHIAENKIKYNSDAPSPNVKRSTDMTVLKYGNGRKAFEYVYS